MAGPKAGLSRRAFAAFCGAAPGVAALAASSPEARRVEAFKEVSAKLTGFPAAALDARFASVLWQALAAAGHQSALEALLADADCDVCEAVQVEIVSAWYSGTLPDAAGTVAAAPHDALIWRALWFAHPPSVCAPGWDAAPQPS